MFTSSEWSVYISVMARDECRAWSLTSMAGNLSFNIAVMPVSLSE